MGNGPRNMYFSITLTICFILQSCKASPYKQQQHLLPSAMAVGIAYCNRCSQQDFSKFSHSIPDASVAVICDQIGRDELGFHKLVKTNQHGVFRFRLPLKLGREIKARKTSCSVKLARDSQYLCYASSSSATSADLRLTSTKHGFQVFSAKFFAFKPQNQPEACNHNSRSSSSAKRTLLSSKRVRPALFFPPPIPFLPSPPNIGGVPLPPNPLQPPSIPFLPSPPNIGGIPLPSNPLQPPPAIIPPLPFQPPPPPFIGIPPIPSIPPLPSLVPPPSPPPPTFSFPPIPFPPIFPGQPPSSPAQNTP